MKVRLPVLLIGLSMLVGACASPAASPDASEPDASEPATSQGASESLALGTITSVFDLQAGDCFNEATGDIVEEVEVVPCSKLHDYEIYGTADYPAGSGEPYPGDTEVQSFVDSECVAMFESFVGRTYDESELYIYYLAPTEDSWGSGDREVVCALYLPEEQLEGSMEGSGR